MTLEFIYIFFSRISKKNGMAQHGRMGEPQPFGGGHPHMPYQGYQTYTAHTTAIFVITRAFPAHTTDGDHLS